MDPGFTTMVMQLELMRLHPRRSRINSNFIMVISSQFIALNSVHGKTRTGYRAGTLVIASAGQCPVFTGSFSRLDGRDATAETR